MLRRNILICAAAVLAAVAFTLTIKNQLHMEASTKPRRSVITDRLAKLNTISVPEKGITRDEMLRRFGSAHALMMEYDRERESNVTRFYYRIGDSDIFFVFICSYKEKQDIVDFSMKEGYYMLNFTDYGY